MVSLTDINAKLASVMTGIAHLQVDVDKIYTYLDTLVTHTESPHLLPPMTFRDILENIKEVWHNTDN